MFKQMFTVALSFFFLSFVQAQDKKTAEQHYNDGISFQNQKKYEEAMAAFKNAIYKNPGYKEALYGAGWICNEIKKYAEAIPYLQKAKTVWPKEPKVFLELGYAYEMLNKKSDAIDNYNTCISIKKDYPLAYKYLGRLYYDDYNYKKSLENLKQYIDYVPDTKDEDVYYRKAVSENEVGKYADALVSIKKASDLKPDNIKFLNEAGYTCYLLENADDALNFYSKAAALDSKSEMAANGLADVYRKLKKNNAQAVKFYAKTIQINPKNIKANYWTGWCYNESGNYNEAIPYLKKVLEVDDKYVSAYTELGYCDYALKNYDDALDNFKKAFAIEKTALTLYYTGLCFIGKKDKASAQKMMNDLKSQGSDYAESLQKLIDKM